ncbi:MAG TPA: DUF4367 domain-containing protein [Anoxybacillus sp.]|jgi:hypothetical protein|nr:DUF4367 domain-containing protein [Anoxybacillus sp.]
MKKKHIAVGTVLTAALVLGGGLYHGITSKATTPSKVETSKENVPKTTVMRDLSSVPFAIKEPTFIPEGLKKAGKHSEVIEQGGHKLTIVQQGWGDENPEGKLKYQQKELLILQSSDDGSNKPFDILSRGEKTTVAGVDAWIIKGNDEHDPVQIMFWKDGKYFNVRGMNIPIEQLIKVAESLK